MTACHSTLSWGRNVGKAEVMITQSRAAAIMGVAQPRISDLVRGKIGLFTIDTLVNMVTAAGLKVDVDITAGRPGTRNKQVA